jgi:hypothetical protein
LKEAEKFTVTESMGRGGYVGWRLGGREILMACICSERKLTDSGSD